MKSIAYAIVVAACMATGTFGTNYMAFGVGVVAWVALLCRDEK